MPEELKKQLDEMKSLWEQMKKKLDEAEKAGRESADVKAVLEKMEKRMEELEVKLNRPPAPTEENEKRAQSQKAQLQKSAFFKKLSGKQRLSDEEQKAFGELQEMKTILLGDDSSAGYLAPPEFAAEILRNVIELDPVRELVTVRTIGGRSLQQPKMTEDETSTWLDEQSLPDPQDFDIGQIEIPANLLGALSKVTKSTVEDVATLEAELRAQFAMKLAKGEGAAIISGNGVKKPQGLLTNSNVGSVTTAVTNVIGADDLIDTQFELKEPYWANARWLMARGTLKIVRKLKDNDGRYLWEPGFNGGIAPTILGSPYTLAPSMPAKASNAYPIIYGDLRAAYKLVDRRGMEVQVLVEKYAPIIGYLATVRVGGQVVLAEAIKKLKVK